MSKYTYAVLVIFLLLPTSYAEAGNKLTAHIQKEELGDLERIIEKRYLRVLTTRNPFDYYIYQGRTKGIQYEMVKEFTKYLNNKYVKKGGLRIVFEMIPVDFDQLIPMLKSGKGDLIAVGLTKTKSREKQIAFTVPYRLVDEVIVTRKEYSLEPWVGKTFHIQKDSSFYNSISDKNNLVKIKTVDPNFHAGNIMEFISLRKYDYTLVNSFWAQTVGKRYKNLIFLNDKSLRKNIDISWAVRKENPKLLNELNSFLPKVKKGSLLGNLFSYKYFYDVGNIQSKDFDLKTSKISEYDNTFKEYAIKYSFDWRLLASLCYQESRFEAGIENKWGAIGLFQIKQMTANEPYINIKEISGIKNNKNNIHAGVKYLSWIKNRYFDPNEKMTEQSKLRMMMAAYNAGPRRVLQAINKAKELGLNPNIWFRNVELAMLKLGYPEPVIYVSEINKHYVSYLLLGIK
ncbi:MAG: membrane-bound lytic murein transglycosylase MltF [Bacteriovoracaceae bacterium]|jgi:membrane-bound lytic murein transglycosylase MltF